jgi:hypothetical protein
VNASREGALCEFGKLRRPTPTRQASIIRWQQHRDGSGVVVLDEQCLRIIRVVEHREVVEALQAGGESLQFDETIVDGLS